MRSLGQRPHMRLSLTAKFPVEAAHDRPIGRADGSDATLAQAVSYDPSLSALYRAGRDFHGFIAMRIGPEGECSVRRRPVLDGSASRQG